MKNFTSYGLYKPNPNAIFLAKNFGSSFAPQQHNIQAQQKMITDKILYEFSQDNFGSWKFWKQDQFSVKFCLEKQGNNSKTQLALLITLNEQQVQSNHNTRSLKKG